MNYYRYLEKEANVKRKKKGNVYHEKKKDAQNGKYYHGIYQ